MTFEEFVSLVQRMRDSQKHYFQTRNNSILAEARDAERRVDAAIALIRNPPKPDLFGQT